MKWTIVTDSSCDIDFSALRTDTIEFARVPFVINISNTDYVDDENLDVNGMIAAMESSAEICRTACPAPGVWFDLFEDADQVIAITISSKLSGSYNSANTAKEMILEDYPDKKIKIVDSKSAGPALAMFVEEAIDLINTGKDFEEVSAAMDKAVKRTNTVFALSSYKNLIKNGRVGKVAGFIAGKLGIWGIGVANDGEIDVKSKSLSVKGAIEHIIQDMKDNGFSGGQVFITHCQNLEVAEKLQECISELWGMAKVKLINAGGLCGFYAERKGLIIAY